MKANTRFIRIYEGELSPGERSAFAYRFSNSERKVLGLLMQNRMEVSLSFENENDLELLEYRTPSGKVSDIPASLRIFSLQREVEPRSTLRGVLSHYENTNVRINLYALIAYED